MTRNRIRTFNKYITNRITRRFASFSHGPFALICHVGRRSGKPYKTPIMVEPIAEGFVIALTYGESVDWYRNVQAAVSSSLLWHGRVYTLKKPEPIDAQTALPLFSPFQRLILRIRGIPPFVFMKSEGSGSTSPRT